MSDQKKLKVGLLEYPQGHQAGQVRDDELILVLTAGVVGVHVEDAWQEPSEPPIVVRFTTPGERGGGQREEQQEGRRQRERQQERSPTPEVRRFETIVIIL